MKPFKLHVKTTIIVSAVVVVIFAIVSYFYNKQTVGLEHKQYAERAQQLATYLADRTAAQVAARGAASAAGESQAELIQGYGFELVLAQKYTFYTTAAGETKSTTTYVDPRSTVKARELTPDEVTKLVNRDFPEPELTVLPDGRFAVWAVAPVIVRYPRAGLVVGAVGVQVDVPESKSLANKMNRFTLIAMVLIFVCIAIATYLLFKRLVYNPIDTLLCAMARAESGDLSVEAKVRDDDEIGLLTTRFNHMVERLRQHAEERAEYSRQLEDRVSEATLEVEERNRELVQKNVELFNIQRQLGQLERLATAGQLAAQFAHEVGTPLNLISGHVQLLRARETDERTTKRLDTIAAQIARIERIVRGMLDQTRRPTARLEPIDLGALLARLFDTIAPTLVANDVTLSSKIEPDLPEVDADGDQLQQVFINLVNNSLDAMPDGGTLRVAAHRFGEEEVKVEFSDTGHGIAEEILPHLFEPLFTTKERGQGSGFGLAVSQQIVREHGGRIEVDSSPTTGTTFTIILPIPPARDAAPPADDATLATERVQ